jgi:hypothetical protein
MSWLRQNAAVNLQLQQRGLWVEPTLDGALDLAAGRIDALLDDTGYAWDLAPAVLIVEAGGRFVDPDGGHRIDRFGGCFTNGRIDAALRLPTAR